MKRKAVLAGVLFFSCTAAQADLVFTLDNAYTGDSPAGAAPWLTATFSQTGVDAVRLTVQSNLSGAEFVSKLLFNVDSGQAVSGVFNSGLSSGLFGTPLFAAATNAFSAGGGALYDMQIDFDIAPPADRFDNADIAVFDLTGVGLTEADFDFFSLPGGGGISFKTAAHIQGIGAGATGSGWISGEIVPLPPAAWASLSCLAGVIGMSWWRRRMAALT